MIVVAVVTPVPPLATASVPASVIAPLVADDGVNPVVPPPKVVTPVPEVKYVELSKDITEPLPFKNPVPVVVVAVVILSIVKSLFGRV